MLLICCYYRFKKCQKTLISKSKFLLPKYLSKFSIKYNFKLIQISTDQFCEQKI